MIMYKGKLLIFIPIKLDTLDVCCVYCTTKYFAMPRAIAKMHLLHYFMSAVQSFFRRYITSIYIYTHSTYLIQQGRVT